MIRFWECCTPQVGLFIDVVHPALDKVAGDGYHVYGQWYAHRDVWEYAIASFQLYTLHIVTG